MTPEERKRSFMALMDSVITRQDRTLRALADYDGNHLPALHMGMVRLSTPELLWLMGEMTNELNRRTP